MKSLTCYIQEKLIIKKSKYNYFPKTKAELKDIITQHIKAEGNEVDLNDIDVSKITDMSNLFENLDFNGNVIKTIICIEIYFKIIIANFASFVHISTRKF